MIRLLTTLVGSVLVTTSSTSGRDAHPPEHTDVLRLSELGSERELALRIWQNSPELESLRGELGAARAEVERALLLPNPEAELNWGTIPLGPTNPPGLARLGDVPNYAASLSYLIEIGKRDARQASARHAAAAAAQTALEALRQRLLDLREVVGEIAATELTEAALVDLARDAEELTALQQQRAERGDAASLDADRAALEGQKLEAKVEEQRARRLAGLRSCAELTGLRCEPFGGPGPAAAYLEEIRSPRGRAPRDDRPDLRALAEGERAAAAALRLAEARAIPDPTLKAGYLRDQFVISGNQRDSLFVGLSFPLPLFDRGQADIEAAEVAKASFARRRALLLERGARALETLDEEARALETRRERIQNGMLPLARALVERLEQAVARGGAPLPDLLLARRSLGELTLDAIDLDLARFKLAVARMRTEGGGAATEAVADLARTE